MQPSNPFQLNGSIQQPSGSHSRWSQITKIATNTYVWVSALIIIFGLSIFGIYYWMTGTEPTSLNNRPDKTTAVTDPEYETDQPKDDESEAIDPDDKKENTKKEADKKPTTSTGSTGGSTTKPPQQSPSPSPSPSPTPSPSPPPSNPAPPAPTPPPSGYVKPTSSNTGPRQAPNRTLTPEQALTELRNTGYLSRVTITGRLSLSNSDGRNWLIEDSIIHATGYYGIHAYNSIGSFTGTLAERPVFRYVEVIGRAARDTGRCSAVVYGSNIVLEHADLYGCDDGVKASRNVSIISSWMHDNDHPDGAHCDSLQITSGTNILVAGSRFDAYVGYSSDGSQVPSGSFCSGGLQTGSVTGPISARFENNWFAGGQYTIRGSDTSDPVSYVFENNKWMRNGTSVALGLTNLAPNRYGPVTAFLGDFDSSNVWEDTGLPVRN